MATALFVLSAGFFLYGCLDVFCYVFPLPALSPEHTEIEESCRTPSEP